MNHQWSVLTLAISPLNYRSFCVQRVMNLNNQNALYRHGMTPVFRLSGNPTWTRLKQKVKFEVGENKVRDARHGTPSRASAFCRSGNARLNDELFLTQGATIQWRNAYGRYEITAVIQFSPRRTLAPAAINSSNAGGRPALTVAVSISIHTRLGGSFVCLLFSLQLRRLQQGSWTLWRPGKCTGAERFLARLEQVEGKRNNLRNVVV